MRKEPNNDCGTALTWTPEGRRKRGRPKTTWRRTAERERERAAWKNRNKMHIAAVDRAGWRESVEAYVPHGIKTRGYVSLQYRFKVSSHRLARRDSRSARRDCHRSLKKLHVILKKKLFLRKLQVILARF